MFKACDGHKNWNAPSPLVMKALPQKVQGAFGDVWFGFLKEEAGQFKGRLQLQSPVFVSVGFLDFKVKGNSEGELLKVQSLKPE